MINTRVGFGYDMHKLEEGSYIMLGGIRINSNYTVVAHSDGDIVLHSLSDAIYGFSCSWRHRYTFSIK
jgi:2-C-methyl-D-erythritol 2,4-cyclodiphosphate synthase